MPFEVVRYTAALDEAAECLGDVRLACAHERQGSLIAKVQFRNKRLVQQLINQRPGRLPAAGKVGGRASRSGKLDLSIGSKTLVLNNQCDPAVIFLKYVKLLFRPGLNETFD